MKAEVNPVQPLFDDRTEIIDYLLHAIGAHGCATTRDRFDAIDAWLFGQEITQEGMAFASIRVALITGMLLSETHECFRFFFDTDPNSPLFGCICLANFQNQRGLDLVRASFAFCQLPRGRRLAAFAREITLQLQPQG